jgi:hypothetical protein
MRKPESPPPDDDGRWPTIRYALDSNARTIRLCCILLIGSSAIVVAAITMLPHLLAGL